MSEQQEFTSRPYQIAIYEKSVAENSIVYLPTGSGKTYIAVLVIKELSGVLHKPYVKGGKRTVFTVNTAALVQQQCAFLARHTGLIVQGYTGDQQVHEWTEEEWLREITSTQVMVMTAQIFLNLLQQGIMPLSKVNLLIFDECHHAVNNHPMRQIMQNFANWPKNQHPRVLAMSGSLLNANISSNNLNDTLKELETTYQSKIITAETLENVQTYSTKPIEIMEYYDPPKEHATMDFISKFIANAELQLCIFADVAYKDETYLGSSSKLRPDSRNTKLARILSDIKIHLKEMGLYGGYKSILLHLIQLDSIRIRHSNEKNFIGLLATLNTQLIKIQKLISNQIEGDMSQDFLDKYASPKVSKLVQILKNFYLNQKSGAKFCCIVFVDRRFTAKVLYLILKELSSQDKTFEFLKPDYIIGQSKDPYKNAKEHLFESKRSKEVLSKFKSELVNCIIATDVVDEGIDIPSCTLVVRYRAPMDFRSYIQSKGRARHSTSHFVILVQHGDHQYLKRHDEFKKTEQALHEVFHGRSLQRQAPTDTEVEQSLYDHEIEPYVITRENGYKSFITAQNAISVINTYCNSLSTSMYSTVAPIWIQEDVKNVLSTRFVVHLTLPVASPLKCTISGDQCQSIDAAKRSAAFKTCVQLYEIGQLDDNLSPRRKKIPLDRTKLLFPHMLAEDKAVPTKAKKRYEVTYPKVWFAAYPKDNVVLYLHVIQMIPINVESSSRSAYSSFYDALTRENTYGILSTKRMPEIPAFSVFTCAGEFQIRLNVNNLTTPLTCVEINLIKQFHYLVFNEMLALSKDFMTFDAGNEENCFLVVPVGGDGRIDWDIVNVENRNPTMPTSISEVKRADYEHSLVLPNYRASGLYFVTEVCSRITANSPFPTRPYNSYADYFKKKYSLVIKDPDQPMLKVRPLPTELNWLKPRNHKSKSSNFEELLVPELVRKITYPAVYWLKAAALPSILHRTSQLLVAEELRVMIATDLGFDSTEKSTDEWNPWIVSETPENNLESGNAIASSNNFNSRGYDTRSDIDSTIKIDVVTEDKSLYTWAEEQEPLDLDRNADSLTYEDLDYYCKFMSHATAEDKKNLKQQNSIKCSYSYSASEQEPPLQMLIKVNARGPSPVDILQSLTAKTSNDVLDYERLETLGDAFLKYIISLYLYQKFPNDTENVLTDLKGKIVSNLNLYCCGKSKNLAGRMSVEEFTPTEHFKVPAFGVDRSLKKELIDTKIAASVLHDIKIPEKERMSGVLSESTRKFLKENLSIKSNGTTRNTGAERFLGLQLISDKCVADCVEAIVGQYLTHLGIEGALSIVKWFGILPKNASVEECLYSPVEDPRKAGGSINQYMPWASDIEKRIGYTFRNQAFLLQAFTHQTFVSNRITNSYERFEFLGDSVLDFLLTVYIYETCDNLNPGELTDLRSALVNNITFACLSVRYGLHTALLAHSPALFCAIDEFVRFQENRGYKVDDELLWVLLEEDDCNMSEHVDVPKVLGDLFESVVAAVYLDSGKNVHVTWKVIYNLMKRELETFSNNVPKQPIRVIHETIGANPKFSSAQPVQGTTNVMVTLSIYDGDDRKFFHGFGATKKLAKCAASKQALKYLRCKK